MKILSMGIAFLRQNIRSSSRYQPLACALSRSGFQPLSATPLTRVSDGTLPAPSRHIDDTSRRWPILGASTRREAPLGASRYPPCRR